LLEVANVSIVAAAEVEAVAEAAAVVVKGDLMLSPADGLRCITGLDHPVWTCCMRRRL
jgi:hypothetical protein